MTAKQIGELTGERTNTIEVALHRALGRLRGRLAPEHEERISAALEPVRV